MKNLILCVLVMVATLSSVAYSQDDTVYTATGDGSNGVPLATGDGGNGNPTERSDNEKVKKTVKIVCFESILDTKVCQTMIFE